MQVKTVLTGKLAILLLCGVGSTLAHAENTTPAVDPMAAYIYEIPANSWYSAKIKPKMKLQAEARSGQAYTPPPATTPPPPATTDNDIANSPIAHKPEPMRALPFWEDTPVK